MINVVGIAKRVKNGLNKRVARILLPSLLKPDSTGLQIEIVGEGDGAWAVPANLLKPGDVCYCVGVGVNATFDVALAARFKCDTYSFDPTPRSIQYVADNNIVSDRLTFVPVGVWKEEAELKFFAPSNRDHVNHSVIDIHGTGDYFTATCKRLSKIMGELGHPRIKLLKLDIEGAWEAVVSNAIDERIEIGIICVEFDTPTSIKKAMRASNALKNIGYKLAHVSRDNYVFVQRSLIA